MDILEAKHELQKMPTGNLLQMAMGQKLSKCLVGAKSCGYALLYKGIRFCVSELLGRGCLSEKLGEGKRLEGTSLLSGENLKKFKVYYRNDLTRCMVYLGTVLERREKERGNNLGDLLKKAATEYSNNVPDPSKIFLLGP
jgi:hypothetical protein